jgi:membrane-associated phospholipid phosphatase
MPSNHNTCTFLIFLIFCFRDEHGKRHKIGMFITGIFYLLVASATILVRQHVFLDIITGITICGCCADYISRNIKFDQFTMKLADKFNEHLYKLRIVTKAGAHHKLAFAG